MPDSAIDPRLAAELMQRQNPMSALRKASSIGPDPLGRSQVMEAGMPDMKTLIANLAGRGVEAASAMKRIPQTLGELAPEFTAVGEEGLYNATKPGMSNPQINEAMVDAVKRYLMSGKTAAPAAAKAGTGLARLGEGIAESVPRLTQTKDMGGTLQVAFDHPSPISVEHIKSMFPNQQVSVERLISQLQPHLQKFKLNFWKPDGALDYAASKAAEGALGGMRYE